MARSDKAAARDPHQRFAHWLETASEDEPPRDLAVHAAVCATCQQRIGAMDMLTAIDPAMAGMPQVRALPSAGWLRTTGRAAVVVGGVAALAAVGIGSWRLMQASSLLGPAIESPTQAVLGGTGGPEASATPGSPASATPSPGNTVPSQAAPTPQRTEAPPPSYIGQATPPPAPPATARPTAHPTVTPRPIRTPAPTPLPTQPPTPQPTPIPTPVPTPEPTPTPLP